tara:strand:- start:61575 stop:63113 length:1539 start_codon:yes stop_codon:yes gene_type:complete
MTNNFKTVFFFFIYMCQKNEVKMACCFWGERAGQIFNVGVRSTAGKNLVASSMPKRGREIFEESNDPVTQIMQNHTDYMQSECRYWKKMYEDLQRTTETRLQQERQRSQTMLADLRAMGREKLEQECNCQICQHIVAAPASLACGHTFCRPCITRWVFAQGSVPTCPTCRTQCTEHDINPEFMLQNTIDTFGRFFLSAEDYEELNDRATFPATPINRNERVQPGIFEFEQTPPTPVTPGRGDEWWPSWTAGDRVFLYSSEQSGTVAHTANLPLRDHYSIRLDNGAIEMSAEENLISEEERLRQLRATPIPYTPPTPGTPSSAPPTPGNSSSPLPMFPVSNQYYEMGYRVFLGTLDSFGTVIHYNSESCLYQVRQDDDNITYATYLFLQPEDQSFYSGHHVTIVQTGQSGVVVDAHALLQNCYTVRVRGGELIECFQNDLRLSRNNPEIAIQDSPFRLYGPTFNYGTQVLCVGANVSAVVIRYYPESDVYAVRDVNGQVYYRQEHLLQIMPRH